MLKLLLNFEHENVMPCEVCHKAKQTREPFPLSEHKTSKLGELIHLDVWGPYKVLVGGFRFFLIIVDDFTKATWVYLLKSKSDVLFCFQEFHALLENQFGIKIKTIRSDNGSEFVNFNMKTFLERMGIVHQTSCVHTPQQNGVVERKYKHLLNVSRSLLFQSGLPRKFWEDVVLTAVFLINKTPSSVLNGKTPFELVYNCVTGFDKIIVFGCLCFSTKLDTKDKLSERSEKYVLSGYSNVKK